MIRGHGRYQSLIDNLAYTYSDNLTLKKVDDLSNNNTGFYGSSNSHDGEQFIYDSKARLIEDKNKGLTYIYNHLDRVKSITWNNTSNVVLATSTYKYSATGLLLQKTFTPVGGTSIKIDYCNQFSYQNNNLSFFLHPYGRVVNEDGYKYQYYLKDHLGSPRVIVGDINGIPTAIQSDHFYTFGMRVHDISVYGTTPNYFLYTEKELQTEQLSGGKPLHLYDYGARMYDPSIGRWNTPDPHAESYINTSPNAFVSNNPVNYNDPTGMDQENPSLGGPSSGSIATSGNSAWITTIDFGSSGGGGEGSYYSSATGMTYGGKGGEGTTSGNSSSLGWDDFTSSFDVDMGIDRDMNNNSESYTQLGSASESDIDSKDEANLSPSPVFGTYRMASREDFPDGGFGDFLYWLDRELLKASFFPSFGMITAGRIGLNVTKGALNSPKLGEIIGWGNGQGSAAVEKTANLAKNLTKSQVEDWAKQGLTKSWVQDQLTKYTDALLKGGEKLKNTQLPYRKELMEKILNLWD